jgi:predicted YcjX-like family ATPase
LKRTSLIDSARIAAGGLKDFASGLGTPTVRLGVTGLARAGKTVFITALVHALTQPDGRLPLFDAPPQGRISRAYLEPQPDDDRATLRLRGALAALVGGGPPLAAVDKARQPSSASRSITTPQGFMARNFGRDRLHIDIVDYPGEWLLDLALIERSYAAWASEAIARARAHADAPETQRFLYALDGADAAGPEDEAAAAGLAALFTAHLSARRADPEALAAEPPGRFLMPGDLAGSPALTFAPLPLPEGGTPVRGTFGGLMERRYEAYRTQVVKPFFRDHFARLDRQIILVDALTALNAGADAMRDLQKALADVLSAFRQGANSWASALVGRRIDRIVFAAAKADLIHHTSHDRLEAILGLIVKDAAARAEYSGADIDIAALAAIRATREATLRQKGEDLPCIVGIPQKGETIGAETFDGETEAAIFPGDLPADPQEALRGGLEGALRFVKFRPPLTAGRSFPQIRLDRTLEFLLGDRFR